MANMPERSLEEISDVLLITAEDQEKIAGAEGYYFCVAGPDKGKIVSVFDKLPPEVKVDIEDIIQSFEIQDEFQLQDDSGLPVYLFYSTIGINITPYLSRVEGLENYNLEFVGDIKKFRDLAIRVVNKYFIKYFTNQQKLSVRRKLEEGIEEGYPYDPKILDSATDLIIAYDADGSQTQASLTAKNDLRRIIHVGLYPPLEGRVTEIERLAKQKGPEREKLIAVQSQLIFAVLREDYKSAAELHARYPTPVG